MRPGSNDTVVGSAGEGADVEEEGAEAAREGRLEGGGEAGGGAGLHERGADGVADEVVDEAGLAEADFGLGGMDVDVDLLRGHFEEEQDDGERGGRDDVAVGLGEGVEDEAVADEAVVDEDVDGVAVELLQLGLGDEAGEAEEAGVGRGRSRLRASRAAARAGRRGRSPSRRRWGACRSKVSRPKIWKRRSAALATAGAMRRAWVAEWSSKCLVGWARA